MTEATPMSMIETSGSDTNLKQLAPCRARVGLIDAHAHVFERGLPLARQHRYAPDYDAPLDAYLEQLDSHGFSRGVLVQPSFLGTDSGYLLNALREAPARLRGIAVIEPDCRPEKLASMARAGVRGVRLNLIGLPDLPLEERLTRETLACLRQLGWHVEVHAEVSRLDHIVEPLLAEGLNVVVDHFGRPDHSLDLRGCRFRHLLQLAGTRRVWVKLSAAYRNWRNATGERHAHDAAQFLIGAFTVERLLWGSDWPHTQYERSVNFSRTLESIRRLVPDEVKRHAILSDTPARLYGFSDDADTAAS
jgi:predicted TIM-barrel fold metal-dependent hydrolase